MALDIEKLLAIREIEQGVIGFAREQGLAGTPVIVRSDGAVIEGFRPREVLEQWLKGAKS